MRRSKFQIFAAYPTITPISPILSNTDILANISYNKPTNFSPLHLISAQKRANLALAHL